MGERLLLWVGVFFGRKKCVTFESYNLIGFILRGCVILKVMFVGVRYFESYVCKSVMF